MFSSSKKRRSIFFGGGNNNNNTPNKENIATNKSTFKTFSVVHVNDTETAHAQQASPAGMTIRRSSQYRNKKSSEVNKQPIQQYNT